MVFYLRSLAKNFKFSFAYFGTNGMNAYQIMTLFWDTVSILELTCKLPVIFAVCDGASPNRKFFKMHEYMDDALSEVVYRSINMFGEEDRYIYFFADPPHLMKTSRNCIHHSDPSQRSSRHLWNQDGSLMWDHIYRLVYDDIHRHNPKITKLTLDHINLATAKFCK